MTPKSVFLADPVKVARHQTLVANDQLRDSLMVAFNELSWGLPAADNPQTSWAANARRQGAKELIETLLSLGVPPKKRDQPTAGKLEPQDANASHNLT